MKTYLACGSQVKKQNVMDMVTKGVIINVLGLGSTLLGIQALVCLCVCMCVRLCVYARVRAHACVQPYVHYSRDVSYGIRHIICRIVFNAYLTVLIKSGHIIRFQLLAFYAIFCPETASQRASNAIILYI